MPYEKAYITNIKKYTYIYVRNMEEIKNIIKHSL